MAKKRKNSTISTKDAATLGQSKLSNKHLQKDIETVTDFARKDKKSKKKSKKKDK